MTQGSTLEDARRNVDDAIDALDNLDESRRATVIASVLLVLARLLIRTAQDQADEGA